MSSKLVARASSFALRQRQSVGALHQVRCFSMSQDQQESKIGGPIGQLIKLFRHVKEQITDDNVHYRKAQPYQSPADRRRSAVIKPSTEFKPNEDAKGLVVKETSKWESGWEKFKDNNPLVNHIYDIRMKFDESDNIIVRSFRSVSDSVSDRVDSVFEDDESSQVLNQIVKIDPTFDRLHFSMHCETKVIPAVLEAFIAGDLPVLKDWCTERCYNAMDAAIQERRQQGLYLDSKILDIGDVEYITAQNMDEGPVLIFVFNAQQTQCVRDRSGAIVEGAEDDVQQITYMFAMRRNPESLDPLLAWEVLEMTMVNAQAII